ncbi:TIGR03086 family metal-binding protein [Streptomyces sp. JJ36]|uniref:TIGR03086 family metal-binding protein n=1 Tax=Streptomyces sp. JJ36 TaxID=2736645 RepID=UPI001F25B58A|nr:TIGR03086 family metal-binding protein [Streptomyces sp. JJ36]MCF6524022.1 TIGR03086 family protein [Streptomyces sp. JJ36]
MELLDAFDTAFDEFDRLVHRVGTEQWHAGTPCTEWSVRDLVSHLTNEHLWAPHLLRGETLAQVGDRYDGDVLGDEPVAAWERASAASREAFHRPGALDQRVHVTGGQIPAAEYGWQMTTDLAVHGWDLARGIGVTPHIPDALARELHDRTAPQAASWEGTGMFAAPVEVPADASPQDRLVALLGREP